MPRHLLNDLRVRNAKPRERAYRLADGDGLYLFVPPSGARAWQFRYRWFGKPQTATLGRADVLSLAEARDAAHEARKLVASGEHLTVSKRVARVRKHAETTRTFDAVAREWIDAEAKRSGWTPGHQSRVESSLRTHLSGLNGVPVTQITAPLVAPLLNKLESTLPDMAARIRQRLRVILDYAIEQGIITGNPIPARRRGANREPRHMPAVLAGNEVGAILRAVERTHAGDGVKRAHLLLAFCVQRVGEVVGATWDEMDLKRGLWSISRERMKRKDPTRGPHLVPIPPKLLTAIRAWRRQDGNDSRFVCPGTRNTPAGHISRESVEKLYRETLDLKGKHSPHSWRSTFSTMARDAGKEPEVVEAQLDHVVGNRVSAAYDRAKRLELRRALMKWYESRLLELRAGIGAGRRKEPEVTRRTELS
jgi:integrase